MEFLKSFSQPTLFQIKMWRQVRRGGSFIILILLISQKNVASKYNELSSDICIAGISNWQAKEFQLPGAQTDVDVEEIEELSIDAEFPIPEAPQETTITPTCERDPMPGVLFSSDNFPGKYWKDTNCTYRMKAAEGKRVQLTFFVFDVSLNL